MRRKFNEFEKTPFSMYYGTEGDKRAPKTVFFVFKFAVTYKKTQEISNKIVVQTLKDNLRGVIRDYSQEILTNNPIFPYKEHLVVNYRLPKDFYYNGNKPKEVVLELTLRTCNVTEPKVPLKSPTKSIYQELKTLAEYFITSDFFKGKNGFNIHKIRG